LPPGKGQFTDKASILNIKPGRLSARLFEGCINKTVANLFCVCGVDPMRRAVCRLPFAAPDSLIKRCHELMKYIARFSWSGSSFLSAQKSHWLYQLQPQRKLCFWLVDQIGHSPSNKSELPIS
jgi:hypothetical protein